jgi:hypothetical protein
MTLQELLGIEHPSSTNGTFFRDWAQALQRAGVFVHGARDHLDAPGSAESLEEAAPRLQSDFCG